MRLVHLHQHSHASFLDAHGKPEQIAERVQELGMCACAVTDHGNVIAHVPFQSAMRKRGLRPILGCEFYVCDDMTVRERYQESLGVNAIPHVTILARTQEGYANLLKLSRLSWQDGYYYKPRIDWGVLAKYQAGLIVLSGCVAGYPSRLLLNQGEDAAREFLRRRKQEIEHYYIELVPEPGLNSSHETMLPLLRLAIELGIPPVMTADGHFVRPEHHRVQDVMLARSTGDRVDSPNRKIQLPAYQYLCSADELLTRAMNCLPSGFEFSERLTQDNLAKAFISAIDNTAIIANSCEVEIPRAKSVSFPKTPTGTDANGFLFSLMADGFRHRWEGVELMGQACLAADDAQGAMLLQQRYWQRACHEWQVLTRKGFADYMLAIIDVVNWMKSQDALVMLRGSAAGCLILWLTGASEVDPILHDLSFERFYDDNRPDPPDVDIDFEQSRRNEAIQYIYNTYGQDCCSQIAALSALKAKAALVDACAAFGIPRNVYGPLATALDSADADVAHQLDTVTDPAAIKVLQQHPELRQVVPLMIGQYRQASIHAAGVIISSEPLDHVIGVMLGADKQAVAAIDKRGASELGLLKMDFLAVKSLDVIAETARRVWGSVQPLYKLPLEDPKALALANDRQLAGVFQLDGQSAAKVAARIGIHSFEDLVAASALCRPGPADWVTTYRANKEDPHSFAAYVGKYHPIAQEIIKKTFGILIFQEQVMALARELAGFEWPQVHQLRKGVADKLGLDPQKGPAWEAAWSKLFVEGCFWRGVSPTEAEHWWGSIKTHGGYSFNRSHCVSYGFIGAWMLYLKAHHPAEFYATYLELEDDDIKRGRLAREYLALHPNNRVHLLNQYAPSVTFKKWDEHTIVGGLSQLRNVGTKTAERTVNTLQQLAEGGFSPMSEDDVWAALYSALPDRVTDAVEQAGVRTRSWRIDALIELAPWFPVPQLEPEHEAIRSASSLRKLCELPSMTSQSEVVVCGYVKVTDFDHERIGAVIEDETAAIHVRVSARNAKSKGPAFKQYRPGDFIMVRGFWSNDVLYADQFGPQDDDQEKVLTNERSRRIAARPNPLNISDRQQPKTGVKRKRTTRPKGDAASFLPTLSQPVEGDGAGGS